MVVFYTDFIDKRLIQEIRPSYAEIEHIYFLQNSIVEGIQKPRGVGDLLEKKTMYE